MMRSTNPIPRFSNMAALVGGTAMPDRLLGKFLCVDPLHHDVIAAERRAQGSTFETTDIGIPLRSDDLTFRPVFLCNAPDGSMVIADFCEEFIAHGQNYQGQIDPGSGRIYRLRGKGRVLTSDNNLEEKTSAELVRALDAPNLWHRQTAARLLGQRADRSVLPELLATMRTAAPHPALDALWAIHQMDELDEGIALEALRHPSPIVRAWMIRLIGDARRLPGAFFESLIALAKTESDPEVRCQILSTAMRLPAEQSIPLIAATTPPQGQGAADLADPFIPLMTWFALERHCADDSERVLALFEDPSFWTHDVVEQHVLPRIIRRFAEAGSRGDYLRCARLLRLAPSPQSRKMLLAGFDQAFEGRIPPAFPEELNAELGGGSLSMQIRQGDRDAITEGLALLGDPTAEIPQRLLAIHAFGTSAQAEALQPLLKLATVPSESDQALQQAALSATQIYSESRVGVGLATSLHRLPENLRPLALNILASRPQWAIELLGQENVPKSSIDPDLVARMRLHGSEELTALLDKHFPSSPKLDPAAESDAIRTILAAKPGDPYSGESIFTARCASCHTLFFKGGKVGPDLTRYQRDDLSTMLISIVDPNAEIREGYENFIATTTDGRILSGFLADEDANTVVLRGFDGSDTTIGRADLNELRSAGRSLMPAGLLSGLDDQELRDLFAYLKLSQPISR